MKRLFNLSCARNGGQCGDQPLRKWMYRIEEDGLRSITFNDRALINKRNAMAKRINREQIMRDEKYAHAELAVQLSETAPVSQLGSRRQARWWARLQSIGAADEEWPWR